MKEIAEVIFRVLLHFLKRKKAADVFNQVAEIYDCMNRVVNKTCVERFLIIKVENNGGIVKPGCEIYISIVYEVFKRPVESVKESYQKRHVDATMIPIISQVVQQKKVSLIVDEMERGTLKNIYDSEGVRYIELDFLHSNKKALFFSSIGTTQLYECFSDAKQKTEIANALNKIYNIFNK